MARAVHCALVLADPPPEIELAYRDFARELGLLFQIVDDILDVAGDAQALGKPVGSDVRNGKATYVSLHGMDRARELASETNDRVRGILDSVPGPVEHLHALAELTYARQS